MGAHLTLSIEKETRGAPREKTEKEEEKTPPRSRLLAFSEAKQEKEAAFFPAEPHKSYARYDGLCPLRSSRLVQTAKVTTTRFSPNPQPGGSATSDTSAANPQPPAQSRMEQGPAVRGTLP